MLMQGSAVDYLAKSFYHSRIVLLNSRSQHVSPYCQQGMLELVMLMNLS